MVRGLKSPQPAVRPNVHTPASPLASSAVAPERADNRGTFTDEAMARDAALASRSALPGRGFRFGGQAPPRRVQRPVPPIPEGRDGVPMREVRVKVPVSKGEVRW